MLSTKIHGATVSLVLFIASGLVFADSAIAQKLVRYSLATRNAADTQFINDIGPNTDFILVVYVEDLRPSPDGLFAAFVDVTWDPALAVAIGPVDHSNSPFPILQTGTVSPGLIDEAGGCCPGITPPGPIFTELVRVRMRTTGVLDHIRFKTDPADNLPLNATLLFGLNDIIRPCETIYGSSSLRQPTCDFDGDFDCDVNDLNMMLATGNLNTGVGVVMGVNDQYDLNFDGTINRDDIREWLADAACENDLDLPYQEGDANLDGFVDGQDFIIWNNNKFTVADQWDQGDFNGDGVVDGADFLIWNNNKFTSSWISCSQAKKR